MAWKNMKLSAKFFVGFGVVIVLLIAVGAWAIVGINGIVENAGEVIKGNELRGNIVQREVDHLNWTIDLNKLLNSDEVHELLVETDPRQCAFGQWYYSDERRRAEQLVPALRPVLAAIEEPHTRLHQSAVKMGDYYEEVDRNLGTFLREIKARHLIWADRISEVFLEPDLYELRDVEFDHKECALGQYLYSEEVAQKRRSDGEFDRAISGIYDPHQRLHESAAYIDENLEPGRKEELRQYFLETTKPLSYEVLGRIDELLAWHDGKMERLNLAMQVYDRETSTALEDVQGLLQEIVMTTAEHIMTDEAMLSAVENTRRVVIIFVIVASLLGVLLAVVIARGIVRPILKGVSFSQEIAIGDLEAELDVYQRDEIGQLADAMRGMQESLQYKANIIKQFADGDFSVAIEKSSSKDELGQSLISMKQSLNELLGQVNTAVDQVNSGADQVSQASQNLSQGATEQASSLEEITSSTNQINSQSKQNAENATEALQIAKKATSDAELGDKQMEQLAEIMGRINASSDAINKVVKVIDDIAFQINLLALNANVEAARAGKYGKGFAVVADEVRNLAVKSADSVKETTKMVEETVDNIKQGTEAANNTTEQLKSIVDGSGKVANFLEEIAQASREQAQAIEQITEGLDQIDEATQASTASAEESASASEELAGQAQQLRAMVSRFQLDDDYVVRKRLPEAPRKALGRSNREQSNRGIKPWGDDEGEERGESFDEDDFDRF
ncbi:MAG TPA: HAMP domain-containing protein [Sediminispirochaeta sp.]|nr:HAMP domain-containing protein [Sediminispirochaeta sp.]